MPLRAVLKDKVQTVGGVCLMFSPLSPAPARPAAPLGRHSSLGRPPQAYGKPQIGKPSPHAGLFKPTGKCGSH